MRFPWEDQLLAERSRLIETLEGLSDKEFESGPTLCAGWSPRDVLGHVIGLDYLSTYIPFGRRVNAANQAQVERARGMSEVRGTREALGMWLAGRDIVTAELVFSD